MLRLHEGKAEQCRVVSARRGGAMTTLRKTIVSIAFGWLALVPVGGSERRKSTGRVDRLQSKGEMLKRRKKIALRRRERRGSRRRVESGAEV